MTNATRKLTMTTLLSRLCRLNHRHHSFSRIMPVHFWRISTECLPKRRASFPLASLMAGRAAQSQATIIGHSEASFVSLECDRRDTKFDALGSMFRKSRTSVLEPSPVPRFSPVSFLTLVARRGGDEPT